MVLFVVVVFRQSGVVWLFVCAGWGQLLLLELLGLRVAGVLLYLYPMYVCIV